MMQVSNGYKGKYQWGITGKSLPLDDKCKYNSNTQIIPNTIENMHLLNFIMYQETVMPYI